MFQNDIEISFIHGSKGQQLGGTPVFVYGSGFVNSTSLSCRFGNKICFATFLGKDIILCFAPPQAHNEQRNDRVINDSIGSLEVSNNGVDFTATNHKFESVPVESGMYQPGVEDDTILPCPPGSYCLEKNGKNFTLCPSGTYQSHIGKEKCIRCPRGYMCPSPGLPIPRLCASGYVCDITGTKIAEQPCPPGFYCPLGTRTTKTFCESNNRMFGGRNSLYWSNSTIDFGLQASEKPARFWDEFHQLPLNNDSIVMPFRGRYCLDDACFERNSSNRFRLHQPIPCPVGTFCHPGTAKNESALNHFNFPQKCSNGKYCPEGSQSQHLNCAKGFYCQFGVRKSCPIGTFCPSPGQREPIPCEPGTFNFMVGQFFCTLCPLGHFCNGYGRIDPAICPPGFVCSKLGLRSPNILCPPGFYCPNGTSTSDFLRNDTTLRPYPCRPGTFCTRSVILHFCLILESRMEKLTICSLYTYSLPSGVGYDTVKEGNFLYS